MEPTPSTSAHLFLYAAILCSLLGMVFALCAVVLGRRKEEQPELETEPAPADAERHSAGKVAEQPRPEPASLEPASPEIVPRGARVGGRCPYCHEEVLSAEGVACASCLARHHEACWDESGNCSACGGETRFSGIERTRPPHRA